MLFVPGYPSPHQCTLPPGVDRNITIPMDPETLQPSSCSVYVNVTVNNDTENCPDGWDYYTQGETSIVTEVNYHAGISFCEHILCFCVSHANVMPCKRFRINSMCGVHRLSMNSHHKGAVMQSSDVFFVASLNWLLYKQWSCRRFKAPRCSCDVIAMPTECCLLAQRHYREQW